MSDQFVARAERIVDALLESDPGAAMWTGDHRSDDKLPDYSPSAVAERVSMLREASHVLTEIDPEDLDVSDAVDLEMLNQEVSARMFALTETREHEWDPLLHNPGELLNALLLKDSGDVESRVDAVAARLTAIPDALSDARSHMSQIPSVFAETGVAQFRGTADLVRDEVPKLLTRLPQRQAELEPLVDKASRALNEFASWLDGVGEGRSPRLGRRLWEAKLWYTLDTPMSASSIMDQAKAKLDEVTAELDETAARIAGESASPALTAKVLQRLAANRPDDSTVVESARASLEAATDFVSSHDLVSLVSDPVEVIVMPEFARGVSAAYCDPPGSLEAADAPTFFAISPTPSNWTADQVEAFYREYNHHMLHDLTAHEAMPGHYLQLAHSRRHRGRTRARAVTMSGTFVEGWAVYAEELMVGHGYGGLEVRMQQLKMLARALINTIIDQAIHCEGMTEPEAMDLMTRRGFQSEAEAAGKWRRALLTSTQLSEYFVGYTEVAAIAESRPDGVSERAWHDAMLSHGNPSPRHLRDLMRL